jgi:hypothetical protein
VAIQGRWIASAYGLAMTGGRHREARSAVAIQGHVDCFGLRPRNDVTGPRNDEEAFRDDEGRVAMTATTA